MPFIAFDMQHQQGFNWCWAAVAASVSKWRSPRAPRTQCQVAQGVLNLPDGTDCCADIDSCDQDGPLGEALQFCGIRVGDPLPGTLSPADIRTQIDAGKVIFAGIDWTDGGSHFVVIAGYEPDQFNTLHILDPYLDPSNPTYDEFVSSYQNMGSWTMTLELR
jgi:hypothetical protein